MRTPNITTAQIIGAIFGALYPVLTLVGVNLNPEQISALQELNVVAVGLFGADAAIRVGRSVAANRGTIEPLLNNYFSTEHTTTFGELNSEESITAHRTETDE